MSDSKPLRNKGIIMSYKMVVDSPRFFTGVPGDFCVCEIWEIYHSLAAYHHKCIPIYILVQ